MPPVPVLQLNDGHTIPALGLGTGGLAGEEAVAAVAGGLAAGYRLLDTATRYGNEAEVGEAIRLSGVPRDEIVITSKLPGSHHAHDLAVAAVRESLRRLGVGHIDLYLIHWPNPRRGLFVEAWRALVGLQAQGVLRSIGVCNFLPGHLDAVTAATGITPAVNQVELHPYFPQPGALAGNAARGVLTQSWAPLGRASGLREDPVVTAIAAAHARTAAQVVLRWHVQLAAVPIPKSTSRLRQEENLAVFDFELAPDEVAALCSLGRPDGRVSGLDPAVYEDA